MEMDDNEYQQGYEQGIRDLSERLKKYYTSLGGSTSGHTVAYTVDIFKEEYLDDGHKST